MQATEEELSLSDIAATIWSRRGLVVLFTLLFGVLGLAAAFLLPERYEASVVLAPVPEDADGAKLGGGAAGLLSQFGGLAALGGLSLGGGGKKSEALATLQSAALTQTFIAENNLLPILFARQWDAKQQDWKPSLFDDPPTLWDAEKKFRKNIRAVTEDKKTGLVTLTISWKDPEQCAAWATDLVSRTNSYLRSKAIAQSNKNIAYLNDQLSKTSVVDLQKAIYGLVEAEIKKIMVANGSDEYAFRVIDPARVPEERSSPKRLLTVIGGLIAGFLLGAVMALISRQAPAIRNQ